MPYINISSYNRTHTVGVSRGSSPSLPHPRFHIVCAAGATQSWRVSSPALTAALVKGNLEFAPFHSDGCRQGEDRPPVPRHRHSVPRPSKTLPRRASSLAARFLGRGAPASAVCRGTKPASPRVPAPGRLTAPERTTLPSRRVSLPAGHSAAASGSGSGCSASPAPRAPPRAAAGTAWPNVAGPTPPPCPALTHSCARGGTATHSTPGLRGRGGAGLWEVKEALRGGAPRASSGAF